MAKIKRPQGREEALASVKRGDARARRDKAPTSARSGAPSSPLFKMAKSKKKLKKKKYFLHYKKGKYYLIRLDLKKKGHQQSYY